MAGIRDRKGRVTFFRLGLVLLASMVLMLPLWTSAQAADTVDVQILSFNDFHGWLEQPTGNVAGAPAGGVQYFATHMKTLRAQNPGNTVVASAGDMIGGSPLLSGLFHDEGTIEAMNLIGLDYEGVGNHDFDEGVTELRRMQNGGCHPVDGCQDGDGFDGANFQFLGANVRNTTTGETVFPPYGIKTFGGVKIGFIGMTLEGTAKIVSPAGIVGWEFLDEAETANALVPQLRDEGVETIVLLVHLSAGSGGSGGSGFDMCGSSGNSFVASLDPAIDVVVSGHSHSAYNCSFNGVPVTQALSFGKIITQIKLTISTATGNPTAIVAHNIPVSRTVTPDPQMLALLAKYQAVATPIANRVTGSITEDLLRGGSTSAGEQPLGDVIADSHLWGAQAQGGQLAVMNTGGIRTDLPYAQISGGEQPGQVTYGELFNVQPFGNNLLTVTLTGTQIDRLLEQQFQGGNGTLQISKGFTYTQYRFLPAGNRIPIHTIRINGVPIDPNGLYRVSGNSFLVDGGDGYTVLAEGIDRTGGQVDNDATAAYFTQFSPISKPVLNRITRIDSATAADPGVVVTAPAATYGHNVTHTLTAFNDGPAGADGTTLTYTLPVGVSFVSASNGGTYDGTTRKVTWSLGTIANMATTPVTVTLTPTATGPLSATAAITTTTTDPGSGNNSDVESFSVAKAVLTVEADDKSRLFGAANPPLTTTITGFQLGQTLATSGVTGSAACSTAVDETTSGGVYPITCTAGTLASANYSFNLVPGTIEITYSRPCITGTTSALTVPAGQAICVGESGRVLGMVTVNAGGALHLQGGNLSGAVRAIGARAVRICGTHITGSLTITGAGELVIVGGDAATDALSGPCAGNTVGGSTTITNNTAGVEFNNNTVGGSLTVTGNTGTLPPPDTGSVHVVGNTVTGAKKIQP